MFPASGSVAVKVPTTPPAALFSTTDDADNANAVGASFTLVTVIVKTWSKDNPPWSVVRTRTE